MIQYVKSWVATSVVTLALVGCGGADTGTAANTTGLATSSAALFATVSWPASHVKWMEMTIFRYSVIVLAQALPVLAWAQGTEPSPPPASSRAALPAQGQTKLTLPELQERLAMKVQLLEPWLGLLGWPSRTWLLALNPSALVGL